MLSRRVRVIIAAGIILGGLGIAFFFVIIPNVPQAYCAVYQLNCYYPPTANYYNGILQLYQYNPNGHRWALELNPGQKPYNSGTQITPVGGGWYRNTGENINVIRNEVATPHFAQNRPTLGIGGNGPYNQDTWRQSGYMDTPRDWKNVEVSGLFFSCSQCGPAGQGPHSVDFVLRGGVNSGNGADPMGCQATNYHIAYGFEKWKLERDIDHTDGYCKGCRSSNDGTLNVAPGIPLMTHNKVFGFKAVIYNNQANTAVRLDIYLDTSGSGNKWQLAWSYIDKGGDPLIDSIRGPAHCQGERPELPVTWGGPVINFRMNASHLEFRQLTAQEIIPPRW